MAISIDQIKALREATGAGVLDCRKALEQTGGDFDKAVEILREKGLAKAAQRSEREASEGVLDLYSHGGGRVGVMVEVNSETDFVARSENFRRFAHEVALQIAAADPKYIGPEDIPADVLDEERARARQRALDEGKEEASIEDAVARRLDKYMEEVCLVRQPYVRDESVTIGDLLNQTIVAVGERVVIRRFVRWEVGK